MTRPINHEMLTLARESRGLTQVDLATQSGLSQVDISRFENDFRVPNDDQLQRIADVLDYPVSFFRRLGYRYGIGSKGVFHRKRKTLPAKELDRLNARIDLLRIIVVELLNSVDIDHPQSFPSHDPADFDNDIEQIAALVRAKWKLPRGPVKDLVGVIEDAGGVVHRTNFDTTKLDALSQWIPPAPPVFLINSERPGDRVRFTLAHEIGHVIMHDTNLGELKAMEEQADKFAAAFLTPELDILPDFEERITLARLAQLKSKWRVSIATLIRRALDLEVITERQYKSLFEDLSKSGHRLNEPIHIAVEAPSLLQDIIDAHINGLQYTLTEIAGVISLREEELIREYLRNDQGLRIVRPPPRKPVQRL